MRGGVAVAAVLMGLSLVPLAGAVPSSESLAAAMTVGASPHTAGAHRVRLAMTLRYEMQCGYPGRGPLVVTFPMAFGLPSQFARGSVELAGKPIAATRNGRQVTVVVPPHKGVLCSMMGPGSLSLVFTPDAKVSNPAQAGSYRFTASHVRNTFAAKLAVKQS